MNKTTVRYTPQVDETSNANSNIQIAIVPTDQNIFYITNEPPPPYYLPPLPEQPPPIRKEKFDVIQCILCTILTFLLFAAFYMTITDPGGPFNNYRYYKYYTQQPTGTTPSFYNYTLPAQEGCGQPVIPPNKIDLSVAMNLPSNNRRRLARIINGKKKKKNEAIINTK